MVNKMSLKALFSPTILLAVALMAVIVMMILPVPAWVLDTGLAASFALAILIFTVTLFIDGEQDGQGRVDQTVPMLFGTDTCDVGSDAASPVSPDYGPKDNAFNGTVHWVQIDIDENAEDLDHLITPEERYKVAIARQ